MHATFATIAAALAFVLAAGCNSEVKPSSPIRTDGQSAAASGPANPLVGRWEPTEQSSGGISGLMDLREDGTCVSGLAVQVGMTYSLKGNRLSLAGRSGEKVADNLSGMDVAFEGDRMTVAGASTKTRIGTAVAGSSPIVGVWTYEHYTGGPAFERYGVDGTMDLRIPMPGETKGRYTVTDTTLTMQVGEKKNVCSFVLEGDLLTMTPDGPPGGRSRTYRRTSAWYEFPLSEAHVQDLRAKHGATVPPRGK